MSKLDFDSDETAIRDHIVHDYAKIFENQIWNVMWRHVLEETLFSRLALFFFFWHMFPITKHFQFQFFRKTLTHVILFGIWSLASRSDDWNEERSASLVEK